MALTVRNINEDDDRLRVVTAKPQNISLRRVAEPKNTQQLRVQLKAPQPRPSLRVSQSKPQPSPQLNVAKPKPIERRLRVVGTKPTTAPSPTVKLRPTNIAPTNIRTNAGLSGNQLANVGQPKISDGKKNAVGETIKDLREVAGRTVRAINPFEDQNNQQIEREYQDAISNADTTIAQIINSYKKGEIDYNNTIRLISGLEQTKAESAQKLQAFKARTGKSAVASIGTAVGQGVARAPLQLSREIATAIKGGSDNVRSLQFEEGSLPAKIFGSEEIQNYTEELASMYPDATTASIGMAAFLFMLADVVDVTGFGRAAGLSDEIATAGRNIDNVADAARLLDDLQIDETVASRYLDDIVAATDEATLTRLADNIITENAVVATARRATTAEQFTADINKQISAIRKVSSKKAGNEAVKRIRDKVKELGGADELVENTPAVARQSDEIARAGEEVAQQTKTVEEGAYVGRAIPNPDGEVYNITPRVADDIAAMPEINPEIRYERIEDLEFGQGSTGDINRARVEDYKNDIYTGTDIEPVVLFRENGKLIVDDGKHRLIAFKEAGVSDIPTIEVNTQGLLKNRTRDTAPTRAMSVDPQVSKAEQIQQPGDLSRLQNATGLPLENMTDATRQTAKDAGVLRRVGNKANELAGKPGQAVQRFAQELVVKMFGSDSTIARGTARAISGMFGEAGYTKDIMGTLRKYYGDDNMANIVSKAVYDNTIETLGGRTKDASKSLTRIHSVLDPELYKATGRKIAKKSDLTKPEKAALQQLKEVSDFINDLNYQNGLISKKQWAKGKDGKYIMRGYEMFEYPDDIKSAFKQSGIKLDDTPFIGRKNLDDIDPDILEALVDDPAYLMSKRLQQTLANDARIQFGNSIADNPRAVSKGAKKGWTQFPEDPRYGALSGKYVRPDVADQLLGIRFNSDLANQVYSLISAYDRIGLRRFRKKMLTVLNPATRLTNRFGNSFFAALDGIDPVTHFRYVEKARKAINKQSADFLEAQQLGLLGGDNILPTLQKEANQIKQLIINEGIAKKGSDIIKQIDDYVVKSYAKVDDEAKLAAYMLHKKRGLTPEQAAERVARHYQNYRTVGMLWDISAKTPILGNAFARFAGDYLRIATNAMADNPLRVGALAIGFMVLQDSMSKLSGESEEDKQTREERPFQRTFPFTDIPTTMLIGDYEVDFSKIMGATTLALPEDQEVFDNEILQTIAELSPFDLPVAPQRDESGQPTGQLGPNIRGLTGADDPLIGPITEQIIDKDFRGRKISDPDGYKSPNFPASTGEQITNRLSQASTQLSPFLNALRDLRNTLASPTGEAESVYGSDRNTPEAISRLTPIKIKRFTEEEAEAQRGINTFFEAMANENELKRALNKEEQDAYNLINPERKDREGNYIEPETVDVDRQTEALIYTRYPNVFNVAREQALYQNRLDGKPVDPLFVVDENTRQTILTSRTFLQGTSNEEKALLYELPWYDTYKQAEQAYYNELEKYYDDKGIKFDPPEKKDPYPVASPQVQQLQDQFFALPEGTGERSNFLEQYPQLIAHWDKTRAWKNRRRAELGLPPLEDPNAKYAGSKGSGSGGSRVRLKPRILSGKGTSGFNVPRVRINPRRQVRVSTSNRPGGPQSQPNIRIER